MARLSILDILHRGVVYSLAGVTLWAVVSSVAVHRHTIQAGKGSLCSRIVGVVYLAFVQYMERKEAEERQQQEEAARTSGNVSEAVKLGSS
ncbi:hypothetical protein Moror_17904 [Moniliophthora roreri MCA 2997]|uniref:Uncharacterized protein n=2 Tax=Moniliophthora roreri TaxID=221103 RepID=V2XDJ2_MONRO|nr:hypothetical protein Moror_17904 [Moniliophthora roreri MCA 2997]